MKFISTFIGTLILLTMLSFSAVSLVYAQSALAPTPGNDPGNELGGHDAAQTTAASPGGGHDAAQSNTYPKLSNPLQVTSFQALLLSVVDAMIFVGVIVAVFAFIFIGFKLVMAQGNEEALKEAKRWFMYAVIGTAILIGSKVIVQVIENTLISAGVVSSDAFKTTTTNQ